MSSADKTKPANAPEPPAKPATPPELSPPPAPAKGPKAPPDRKRVRELGGSKGPEPTRYGDWEVGGRCSDF